MRIERNEEFLKIKEVYVTMNGIYKIYNVQNIELTVVLLIFEAIIYSFFNFY